MLSRNASCCWHFVDLRKRLQHHIVAQVKAVVLHARRVARVFRQSLAKNGCIAGAHVQSLRTPPCTSRRRPNAQHADDQPLISVAAHAQPGGTTFVMPHASCVMRPRPKPSVPATARFTFRCTARANLPAAFVAASVADLVPSAEARSRLTMSIYRQNQSQRDEVQFFRRLWLRYAAVNPS